MRNLKAESISNTTISMTVHKNSNKFQVGGIGARIDLERIPEGWTYALVNLRDKNGKYDQTIIRTKLAEGWIEVAGSDHPELTRVGQSKLLEMDEKDLIEDGYNTLMKRPKELDEDVRTEHFNLANKSMDIVRLARNFFTGPAQIFENNVSMGPVPR
jgi:hypothetical protein